MPRKLVLPYLCLLCFINYLCSRCRATWRCTGSERGFLLPIIKGLAPEAGVVERGLINAIPHASSARSP